MELALEAGADDVVSEDGFVTVYSESSDFSNVREAFVNANMSFEKAGLELIADNYVTLSDDDSKQAAILMDKLEEHDDVQNVYSNF